MDCFSLCFDIRCLSPAVWKACRRLWEATSVHPRLFLDRRNSTGMRLFSNRNLHIYHASFTRPGKTQIPKDYRFIKLIMIRVELLLFLRRLELSVTPSPLVESKTIALHSTPEVLQRDKLWAIFWWGCCILSEFKQLMTLIGWSHCSVG
jgi:hypothetical protein